MLMLNAMNAWSHAKTDVITVSNGDRITGAMTEMTSGKLSVSTSYAGTISVKWREVSQIDSRYVYEVRLEDGERIYGRFAASNIPEQLAFRFGGKDRQLDIDDVVEVRSIEDKLADKLDLQLSSIRASLSHPTALYRICQHLEHSSGIVPAHTRISDALPVNQIFLVHHVLSSRLDKALQH